MNKFLLIITVLFLYKSTFSQYQHEPPCTLEAGTLQPEMQVMYENVTASEILKSSNIMHPSFLIRYGIANNIELQFNIQYLTEHVKEKNDITATFDHQYNTGIQPVKTGVKFMFSKGEEFIPSAAILVNLSIPKLASPDFRTTYFAPEVLFSASHSSGNFSTGYNFGFIWDGELTEPYETYIISFTYTPSGYFALFAEAYGGLKTGTSADNRIDAGASFFITDNFQLDIAGGLGLSKSSPAGFIGLGMALRLPKI